LAGFGVTDGAVAQVKLLGPGRQPRVIPGAWLDEKLLGCSQPTTRIETDRQQQENARDHSSIDP
jgi:hypothetical protein